MKKLKPIYSEKYDKLRTEFNKLTNEEQENHREIYMAIFNANWRTTEMRDRACKRLMELIVNVNNAKKELGDWMHYNASAIK